MKRSEHRRAFTADTASNAIIYDSRMEEFEKSLQAAASRWEKALIHLERGDFRLQAGRDFDAALSDAEASVENHEWDLSYQLKAKALEALKRYDEAREALDRSIELAKGNDFVHYLTMEKAKFLHRAGKHVHGEGRFEKAVEWFTLAIEVPAPLSAMYWADRGNSKLALKLWDSALDDARQSLKISDTLYGRILEARAWGGWMQYRKELSPIKQSEVELWSSLIDPDDGLPELMYEDICGLGRLYYGSAKEDRATRLFSRAHIMKPNGDGLAWHALSRVLGNGPPLTKDEEKSVCELSSTFSFYVQGVLYLKLKQYDQALLKFNQGLRTCGYKDIWNIQDERWQRNRKTQQRSGPSITVKCEREPDEHLHTAVDIYTQAISLSDHFWFSCKHLTTVGELWTQAITSVEHLIRETPTPKAYCTLAMLHRSVGQYIRALEAFEDAAKSVAVSQPHPEIQQCSIQDIVEIWSSKCESALAESDISKEREYITLAIVYDPCGHDLYAKRSHVAFLQEDWVTALHDVDQCIRLRPKSPIAWKRELFVRYNKEDYDGALEFIADEVLKYEKVPVEQLADLEDGDLDITTSPYEWEHPDKSARSILTEAGHATNTMPLRLIHTPTGRVYHQSTFVTTFKKSDDYKRLLIFLATRPRMWEIIRDRVQNYFKYVMLSHRWDVPEYEPKLKDIDHKYIYDLVQPPRIDKLKGLCAAATTLGFNWTWSDTCCIDKDNPMEVQESIPSMVMWYHGSALTIVHLSDVNSPLDDSSEEIQQFTQSNWFKRGWTLQELLAPRRIIFYTKDWSLLIKNIENHKAVKPLLRLLAEATGIDQDTLQNFERGLDRPRERLRWASNRHTTREEDMAYSLMGIFALQLPVLYAEGKERALGRLLEVIVGQTGDSSILQWTGTSGVFNSCLPDDISAYRDPPPEQPIPKEFPQFQDITNAVKRHEAHFSRVLQQAPAFHNSRLSLTCVIHDAELMLVEGSNEKNVYDVDASGFKPFRVTLSTPKQLTEEPDDVFVIRPWRPEFHIGSKQRRSGKGYEQVLRILGQWMQPSYVLVLGRTGSQNYCRIAGGVAEIEDISAMLETMRIERLEIF